MRTQRLHVLLLVFCLTSTRALVGQISGSSTSFGSPGETIIQRAPEPFSDMESRTERLHIPAIAGAPFRARIVMEITRQLPDGTTVAEKYYSLAARDTNGREYRESRDPVPADSDREPPILHTTVYDPKASLVTICTPAQHFCRQQSFDPAQHPVEEPVGPSSDGKSVLTRDDLGKKNIDGLECTGTRETRTFNAGVFGNDKPVVVTKESWYSTQLQFDLSVTRVAPRTGTQKLEVTDLKLGDPGAEWFVIPDDYRVASGAGILPHSIYLEALEPAIEKSVTGMTADQLTAALQPVEAAISAYAKVHAQAAPDDKNDNFAGQLRQRLSMDLYMLQQNTGARFNQMEDADATMRETYRVVVSSPCIGKPQPGDPPNVPNTANGIRDEQTAWLALRDAWVAFLDKLFPHADPATLSWRITNDRENELRRIENLERIRGCDAEDSIEPLLVRYINGFSPEQLEAAVKPVDAAILAYDKAHLRAAPNDKGDNFAYQVRTRLSGELNALQQGNAPLRPQLEESDLRMKETFREVVNSACVDKPQPGDPPNMPTSAEALRSEQTAWLALRDAWTAFLAKLFPNADPASFGWMITNERDSELRRLQNVERNRGCEPEQSIEPLLARYVPGLSAEQLDAAVKPVDNAIRAYAKARAEAEPGRQNDNSVTMLEQQLASQLQFQQSNRLPSLNEFEEADLRMNQAFRAAIASPCLSKSIPGDPPNAPVSEEKLRDEQHAWGDMRDAWSAFMATVFPNADHTALGLTLTQWRTGELQQIENIERNRGCTLGQ